MVLRWLTEGDSSIYILHLSYFTGVCFVPPLLVFQALAPMYTKLDGQTLVVKLQWILPTPIVVVSAAKRTWPM